MTTLLSLNVWGGKIFDPLMRYISDVSSYVDIFCFQEMLSTVSCEHYDKTKSWRIDLLNQMTKVLPEFTGYYAPAKDWYFETNNHADICNFSYGLATFVHRDIPIECHGDIFIFGSRIGPLSQNASTIKTPAPRNLQYIVIDEHQRQKTLVANFHGLWTGNGKKDTPERLDQSRSIVSFLKQFTGKKILCGDFNLRPETESLRILEVGMFNLINKHQILSTRSSCYDKRNEEPYADYMLVSNTIRVHAFTVMNTVPNPVSDHLPLILDYE